MTIEAPEAAVKRVEPQIFSRGRPHAPGAKMAPSVEVGFFLSREREKHGVSIEAAGEATGIHPYHIEAIESGDLTRMPPRLEAVEMIAGYAQFLGFDAEPLIEHLISFLPPPPIVRETFHPASPPVLSSAKVLSFGKMPKIPNLNIRLANYPGGQGGVIASVAAAFMLFAGLHWMSAPPAAQQAPATEKVAQAGPEVQIPAQVAQTEPAALAVDAMPTASTSSDVADVKTVDEPMASGGAIADTGPSSDDADALSAFIVDQSKDPAAKPKLKKLEGKSAAAQIPDPAKGKIYGAENSDARIVLKATAPVWLRIEDAGGNPIITQMLNTGDTYRVPNRDGLVALSRDGGRLNYVIDGKQTGVLGPAGKILTGEKLDVASLEAKK